MRRAKIFARYDAGDEVSKALRIVIMIYLKELVKTAFYQLHS